MWQYQRTDELYHYGVLGMKWGVRRYQNKDGTLTTNGRKRLYSKIDKFEDKYIKKDGDKINKRFIKENSKVIKDKNMPDNIKKEVISGYELAKRGEIETHKILRRFYSNHLKNISDDGNLKTINERNYKKGYEFYKEFVDNNYDISFKSNINGDISTSFIPKKQKPIKSRKTMAKIYDKYNADDVEGAVRNMSKKELDDMEKQLPKNYNELDVDNYLYKNRNRILKR